MVQQGLIGPLLMGDLARKPSAEFQDLPLTSSGTLKSLGSSLRCCLLPDGALRCRHLTCARLV